MIIGLSQRVVNCPKTNEIRDCLDQNWSKLMFEYGHTVVPIPNNPLNVDKFIKVTRIQGLVLTGGNDIATFENPTNVSIERDQTEQILLEYAIKYKLPVLGVCRGFQFINSFFSGYTTLGVGHVGSFHTINIQDKRLGIVKSATVNSFHNYIIEKENLGDNLIALAYGSDLTVEAAYHKEINCIGIMWHPERSSSILDEKLLNILFN